MQNKVRKMLPCGSRWKIRASPGWIYPLDLNFIFQLIHLIIVEIFQCGPKRWTKYCHLMSLCGCLVCTLYLIRTTHYVWHDFMALLHEEIAVSMKTFWKAQRQNGDRVKYRSKLGLNWCSSRWDVHVVQFGLISKQYQIHDGITPVKCRPMCVLCQRREK